MTDLHNAIAEGLAKEFGAIIYMPVIIIDEFNHSWYSWTFERDNPTPKHNKFSTIYIAIHNGKISLSDRIDNDFAQLTYELADPNLIQHIKSYLTHHQIQ